MRSAALFLLIGLLFSAIFPRTAPATNVYVALPGSVTPQYPYTNWTTAATSIQTAVGAIITNNGNIVYVTNGVFVLTSQIYIAKGVRLQGFSGNPADTIINGGNYAGRPTTNRCLLVSNANAVVDGFTILNGDPRFETIYAGWGGGVCMPLGTVQNCVITQNGSYYTTYAGGVYMVVGLLQNCEVSSNWAYAGGGVIVNAGTGVIQNCRVFANRGASGAGVNLNQGGALRNSLVYNNTANTNNLYGIGGSGAGVRAYQGNAVESCTIVSNTVEQKTPAWDGGGGLWDLQTRVVNTIIYFNSCLEAPATSNWFNSGALVATNCCTAPAAPAGTGNITSDPQLVNLGNGNCRLQNISPCINAGFYQAWMASAYDLDRKPRVDAKYKRVDIGAYEFTVRSTVWSFR